MLITYKLYGYNTNSIDLRSSMLTPANPIWIERLD